MFFPPVDGARFCFSFFFVDWIFWFFISFQLLFMFCDFKLLLLLVIFFIVIYDMISDQDSSISYQGNFETTRDHQLKGYDYLLKFLLVGDPDVGKDEIMNSLDSDVSTSSSSFSNYEQHFSGSPGVAFKSTQILLDGKRIRLQLWYLLLFSSIPCL